MGELSLRCCLLLTMLQMLKLLFLMMVLITVSLVVGDVIVLYGGDSLFGGDSGDIATGDWVDALNSKWIFKQRFYPAL